MSRIHHKQIVRSVSDLLSSVTKLIEILEVTTAAAPRAAPSGRGGYRPLTPKAAKLRSRRLKKSIKASWDRMKPAERTARIKKMLAGRGLKPKKTL
jgi:hypothetical protein